MLFFFDKHLKHLSLKRRVESRKWNSSDIELGSGNRPGQLLLNFFFFVLDLRNFWSCVYRWPKWNATCMYIFIVQRRNLNEKKNERIAAATKDKRIGGLEGLQSSSQHHRLKWARFGIPNPFSGTSFVVVVAFLFSFYESFRSSRLWVARHQLLFLLYNPQVPNEKGNHKRTSSENNWHWQNSGRLWLFFIFLWTWVLASRETDMTTFAATATKTNQPLQLFTVSSN